MSSRRSLRRVLVAVLLGVLVGGGLMAVTPAGAEINHAVATNWKKIWKKNLQKQADKRYYTKKKSRKTFAKKTDLAATDAKLGGYYTKAEGDARYAPMPGLIRGSYGLQVSPNTGVIASSVSFGVTLSAPPTVHYITTGSPVPAGCSGTVQAPGADPGHMCIFESGASNVGGQTTLSGTGSGVADAFGLFIYGIQTNPANSAYFRGTWAVRPAAAVTPAVSGRTKPTPPVRSGAGFVG